VCGTVTVTTVISPGIRRIYFSLLHYFCHIHVFNISSRHCSKHRVMGLPHQLHIPSLFRYYTPIYQEVGVAQSV
jgi:hypothetical protein